MSFSRFCYPKSLFQFNHDKKKVKIASIWICHERIAETWSYNYNTFHAAALYNINKVMKEEVELFE